MKLRDPRRTGDSMQGARAGSVARKLARLAGGAPPRVLDVFSGCGGLSLGFHREGCAIVANVELDPDAARSHALNFHREAGFSRNAVPRDMTLLEPATLASELGLGPLEDAIDVLVGGPPCQAYSRIGRAKLREIAAHPQAFRRDERRNLYLRYLACVKAFRPLALLMENVPDILYQAGQNVMAEIAGTLEDMGYSARYTLINSAFHGVPQTRDRAFLVAFRRELGVAVRFPAATHHLELPRGYRYLRKQLLREVDLFQGYAFTAADVGTPELPGPVTAMDALADLPRMRGSLSTRGKQAFPAAVPVPYPAGTRPGAYARRMREWPGFEAAEGGVSDHVCRRLPRDVPIFEIMPEGAEYPRAYALATTLFEEEAVRRGLEPGTEELEGLRRAMVPPYDPAHFSNRWWKLRRGAPVRTLLAHLGKDCYTHIHYDGSQARTISVREAARLQSFPDGFQFAGTMNSVFRQIGNAVPPLLAAALASCIVAGLREAAGGAGQQSVREGAAGRMLEHA